MSDGSGWENPIYYRNESGYAESSQNSINNPVNYCSHRDLIPDHHPTGLFTLRCSSCNKDILVENIVDGITGNIKTVYADLSLPRHKHR